MLTQAEVIELFDYKDGRLYWKQPIGTKMHKGDLAGSLANTGYYQVGVKKKVYPVHRLIFLHVHGWLPAMIDHVNGNKQDNRVENLRPATRAQNSQNARVRKDSLSGVKNVSWHKPLKKWLVSMRLDNRRTHIGVFEDLEIAKLVATEFRDKYHGEFANHG